MFFPILKLKDLDESTCLECKCITHVLSTVCASDVCVCMCTWVFVCVCMYLCVCVSVGPDIQVWPHTLPANLSRPMAVVNDFEIIRFQRNGKETKSVCRVCVCVCIYSLRKMLIRQCRVVISEGGLGSGPYRS